MATEALSFTPFFSLPFPPLVARDMRCPQFTQTLFFLAPAVSVETGTPIWLSNLLQDPQLSNSLALALLTVHTTSLYRQLTL